MSRNGIIINGERFTLDTLPVKLRATYSCDHWCSDEPDVYPAQWGGWCDPENPWGTADDDHDCDADDVTDAFGRGEPIEIVLPAAEAVEFIAEFPGGVWDLWESEHDQDYRTGVYTAVTLHVEAVPDTYTPMILDRAARRLAEIDAINRRRWSAWNAATRAA